MPVSSVGTRSHYRIELVQNQKMLREAQQLRYRVFAEELGAQLPHADEGLDRDRYDPHCGHILVRDETSGNLIACTRVLSPEGAAAAGGYYSQSEFEITAILDLPGRAVEVGRTCVAAGYRNGAVIGLLWQGIGCLVKNHHVDYLFGCASVPLTPDPLYAHAIIRELLHWRPTENTPQVKPRQELPPLESVETELTTHLPPLIRTYLNLGARACGEPCWDPLFKVADIFMLLNLRELAVSFAHHFATDEQEDPSEAVRA